MMAAQTGLLDLILLACSTLQAVAGSMNKQDSCDPHYISDRPPEVRHYIAAICKAIPAA